MTAVDVTQRGRWTLLTFRTPHLSAAVDGFCAALEGAAGDDDVDGVVLVGAPGRFSKGSDLDIFADPDAVEAMRGAVAALQDFPKRTVALLSAPATGHWAELILNVDVLAVSRGASWALNDIRFGVPPALGGVQALLRRLDANLALRMILTGRRVTAKAGVDAGIFDLDVTGKNPFEAATAYASGLGEDTRPAARKPKSDHAALTHAIAEAKPGKAQGPNSVETAIFGAMETTWVLPFKAAQDREHLAFEEVLEQDGTHARLHLAKARAVAARGPGGSATARPVVAVGVLGAGGFAAEVALTFLLAGIRTLVVDADQAALKNFRKAVLRVFAQEAKAHTDAPTLEEAEEKFDTSTMHTGLSQLPIVIDARTAGKDDAPGVLSDICKVLAPETCVLRASAWSAPDDGPQVEGLHFGAWHASRPLYKANIVEVAFAPEAPDTAWATLHLLTERLQKSPMPVAFTRGLALSRLEDALVGAACGLVEEGASPEEVDLAIQTWGLQRAPFMELDRQGLRRFAGPRDNPPALVNAMIQAGLVGRAAKRGFYAYDGPTPRPDDDLEELLDGHRDAVGRSQRSFSPDDIRHRVILALMNAGAALLRDGTLERAGDVNVLAVLGLGMPAVTGGPLFAAERLGLLACRRDLEGLAATDPLYAPDPLIDLAIQDGQSFDRAAKAWAAQHFKA